MELQALLDDLGKELNTDLTLEDGTCTIAFDDMQVTIMEIKEARSIVFFGRIGATPPFPQEELLSSMLMANHLFQGTGGASISRDPESGDFFLCQNFEEQGLDTERFRTVLEKYLNTLEHWCKILADYRPEDKATEEEPRIEDGNQSDFMMRV